MKDTGLLFILRHCETTKSKNIIPEQYKKALYIMNKYIAQIKLKFPKYKIKFTISPIDRCKDTCNLIKESLEQIYNENFEIIIDTELRRWDSNIESRNNSYERALNYSKTFNFEKKTVNIIISHSSMIPRLAFGFIEDTMKFKEYKKNFMNKKLNNNSIIIIKNGFLKKYNL